MTLEELLDLLPADFGTPRFCHASRRDDELSIFFESRRFMNLRVPKADRDRLYRELNKYLTAVWRLIE